MNRGSSDPRFLFAATSAITHTSVRPRTALSCHSEEGASPTKNLLFLMRETTHPCREIIRASLVCGRNTATEVPDTPARVLVFTRTEPPCFSAIPRHIQSPSPDPFIGLVEWTG